MNEQFIYRYQIILGNFNRYQQPPNRYQASTPNRFHGFTSTALAHRFAAPFAILCISSLYVLLPLRAATLQSSTSSKIFPAIAA